MADAIGAKSFIRLDGEIRRVGIVLAEITRPGANGVGFQQVATRAPISQLEGIVDVASASAVATLGLSYAALKGTIVTITQRNQNFSNMLILEAELVDAKPVLTPVGGLVGGGYLCYSRFIAQYAG